MIMQTDYKSKYFSILGDSISTLAGYNPQGYEVFYKWDKMLQAGIFEAKDTWWGKVIDELGGKLLINDAFSGSLVCKHPESEIESHGCSDLRTSHLGSGDISPDVIMIFLGINDWGWGICVESNDAEEDLSVFSIAYDIMIKKVKKNYPNADIWCMTLPRSFCSGMPAFSPPERFTGGSFEEYCQAIQNIARLNNVKLIDIYKPDSPYDTIDGYHPTRQGMMTIAGDVLAAITNEDCK